MSGKNPLIDHFQPALMPPQSFHLLFFGFHKDFILDDSVAIRSASAERGPTEA
jgi:hypothetical protein